MAERDPAFVPLRWEELSALQHQVFDYRPEGGPSVLVIEYSGEYGHGSGGRGSATYIVATATAAWQAWHRTGLILDFTNLAYAWGDEMEWVLCLGSEGGAGGCSRPLAIILGPDCRAGLQSLEGDEERSVLAEDFQAGLRLIDEARQDYERCLEAWRRGSFGS